MIIPPSFRIYGASSRIEFSSSRYKSSNVSIESDNFFDTLPLIFESFSLNSISNPYTANFTKLAQIPNGNFYVDNAVQKTAIEVDKNGIKAAAVTKITGSNATSFNPNIPIEIWLDRPFAYLIFDRASVELGDVPIFYGVVENL